MFAPARAAFAPGGLAVCGRAPSHKRPVPQGHRELENISCSIFREGRRDYLKEGDTN